MNPNSYDSQKKRGIKRKYEAILQKGGKCEWCGYNKNLSALDFHHLNPSEKSFQLDSRKFSNTLLEKLQLELDKCILLCANCHREAHNPDMLIDTIKDNLDESKISFNKQFGSECPVCGKRFPKSTGKIYCSKDCREKDKGYPTVSEVNETYKSLGTWEKVAEYYGLTRKIIQNIRKNND